MNLDESILVTGGTGFLGSYILKNLLSLGYKNIVAIHRKSSSFELLDGIAEKINWVECDLLDEYELSEVVSKVDVVIHAAAMISFWPKEYKQMFAVNVGGTHMLVNKCLEHKVKKLIYISSIEALGKEEDEAFITEETEWKDQHALSKYGLSKHHGELEIWRAKEEGLDVTVYNPGLIIGAGNWDTAPMSIVRDIFKGFGYFPSGSIGMVDVRDVAELVSQNIFNEDFAGEQYILVGENVSYEDFFGKINAALNSSKTIKKLTPLMASLSITVEKLRGVISNHKPLINKETYSIASLSLRYSVQKIKNQTSFEFRKISTSIPEMCKLFLDSYPKGVKHASFENA